MFNLTSIPRFPGVRVIEDFISKEEEIALMEGIDEVPWDASQSGRRKQVGLKFIFYT